MDRRQFLATATTGAAGSGLAALPAPALSGGNVGRFLDIQGNQVVRDAKAIRLRGTNLGNWMILDKLPRRPRLHRARLERRKHLRRGLLLAARIFPGSHDGHVAGNRVALP